ncbi:MAG: hypothetical protein JXR03_18015 [Cyclobacteriaceae bacterium]
MERRDIIKDEIERLGQVLGMILARLIGKNPDYQEAESYIEEQFSEKLGFDFTSLDQMDDKELLHYLIDERQFSYENLEQLSQIFEYQAKKSSSKKSFQKSLMLLKYVHDHDSTFSFEREARIQEISNKVELL